MPDESVQSVERAMSILLALDANSPSLDAATLSTRTGLSRSTVYRLLGTLEQAGMVRKHGSRFELGPNVLKLAGGYRAANHISLHAKSVLDELAEQVHTGVTLAVLDGDVVVTVETGNAVNGDYVLQPHELGRRIPATATSVGRMLLAFQEAEVRRARTASEAPGGRNTPTPEQIRTQGYALTSRACSRRACARSPCRCTTTPATSSPAWASSPMPTGCRPTNSPANTWSNCAPPPIG